MECSFDFQSAGSGIVAAYFFDTALEFFGTEIDGTAGNAHISDKGFDIGTCDTAFGNNFLALFEFLFKFFQTAYPDIISDIGMYPSLFFKEIFF